MTTPKPPPGGADPNRTHFTYCPGAVRLAEPAAPNTKNRSHRIDACITSTGDGALVAIGGVSAGFVLYVKDGRPTYHYNFFGIEGTVLTSDTEMPDGASVVTFEFFYDGGGGGKGGDMRLLLDGAQVASGRIERSVPGRFGLDTFNVGTDAGSPVSPDYTMSFAFTGTIDRIVIELGERGLDPDAEAKIHARFKAGKDY